jgi:hypothetical protein
MPVNAVYAKQSIAKTGSDESRACHANKKKATNFRL